MTTFFRILKHIFFMLAGFVLLGMVCFIIAHDRLLAIKLNPHNLTLNNPLCRVTSPNGKNITVHSLADMRIIPKGSTMTSECSYHNK